MLKRPFTLVLIVLTAMQLSSCKKSKTKFTDITETDSFGTTIGNIDDTDWKSREEWTRKEKKLFSDFDSYDFDCGSEFGIVAYPNPSWNGVYNFNFNNFNLQNITVKLVDEKLNILYTATFDQTWSFSLTILQHFTGVEGNLRLYYVAKDMSGCYYNGHGDLSL
ncbi:hypothetical protein K6119_16965 [Paracrocinitomix mangrovi]|uniref:hypothetical protein n=1 Tax=Paracrocinitomix mangrovi TaxID=2862509 RepID=UPI001C8E2863|nr:hypothetical protein [Paracrocinitomix mangrovi]UKN01418.1 hypothetical protein K6119_16965 [Paracrocinitomix mangrovi]